MYDKKASHRYYCTHQKQAAAYRKQHSSTIKEYRGTHKEAAKKASLKYYSTHIDQSREYNKEYGKEYRNAHKEVLKESRREYQKQRKKQDVKFRILSYLRTRIYHALKGISKSQSTMKLVGCTLEFLKSHLEKQFKPEMTWDNYGEWHVDHMRPCCSFDLSNTSEQRKCFNYKNLQPLWASENISKGGRTA